MELRHFVLGGGFGTVDFQLLVQSVIHNQGMRHANAMRFHRMARVVGIVSHVGIIKVGDFLGLGGDGIGTGARRVEFGVAPGARRHVDHLGGVLLVFLEGIITSSKLFA